MARATWRCHSIAPWISPIRTRIGHRIRPFNHETITFDTGIHDTLVHWINSDRE